MFSGLWLLHCCSRPSVQRPIRMITSPSLLMKDSERGGHSAHQRQHASQPDWDLSSFQITAITFKGGCSHTPLEITTPVSECCWLELGRHYIQSGRLTARVQNSKNTSKLDILFSYTHITVWIRHRTSSIFVLKRNPPGAVAARAPSCSLFTPITAISEREKKNPKKRKAQYRVLWKCAKREHASRSQDEQLPDLCLRQVILSKTGSLYRCTWQVLGF